MPNPRRRERLASLIEEVVGELLQRQIKDPRVAGLTSVTRVEVTPDARYARLYVSIMGTEEEKQETMRALEHATGFVRSKLGDELTIRHVPEVTFHLDRSIERGDRVLALLSHLHIPPAEPEGSAAAAGSTAAAAAAAAAAATQTTDTTRPPRARGRSAATRQTRPEPSP